MNQEETMNYDNALAHIKSKLGNHEAIALRLQTAEHKASVSSVWRWFTERTLPLPIIVFLVEQTENNKARRSNLVRALIPELNDYVR